MSRIAVLGAGLVGRTIARDLAGDHDVTVHDRSAEALEAVRARVERRPADLSDAARVEAIAREADLVIGAVPGHLGLQTVRAVLAAGTPMVDISFTPEDPTVLDGEARARGVCVVVDCGVAPGISNLLLGRAAAEIDDLQEATILVGGLPVPRIWPFEYRSVFSPTDVIEEYTRPARFRVNGEEVVRPALSEPEPVDIPGVGTLEAFNTDGLRTLLRTIPARTLKEKTLRYPGHIEKMRMLREAGFFSDTPLEVDGAKVRPRALTEKLLFDAWRRPPGEEEFTVLRVEARGRANGRPALLRWDLLDRTDPVHAESSMARTTGFPCAIVARMILSGRWRQPGVHPPEVLGRDAGATQHVLEELGRRNVRVVRTA